jgi:hypothetical protein
MSWPSRGSRRGARKLLAGPLLWSATVPQLRLSPYMWYFCTADFSGRGGAMTPCSGANTLRRSEHANRPLCEPNSVPRATRTLRQSACLCLTAVTDVLAPNLVLFCQLVVEPRKVSEAAHGLIEVAAVAAVRGLGADLPQHSRPAEHGSHRMRRVRGCGQAGRIWCKRGCAAQPVAEGLLLPHLVGHIRSYALALLDWIAYLW